MLIIGRSYIQALLLASEYKQHGGDNKMRTLVHWKPEYAVNRLPLDVFEAEDSYTINVEIPGINPDQ